MCECVLVYFFKQICVYYIYTVNYFYLYMMYICIYLSTNLFFDTAYRYVHRCVVLSVLSLITF